MTTDTVAASAEGGELSTRRERVGWYFYDWATSAFNTTVITVFLGPYLGAIAENAADSRGLVHPLGIPVAAGSLFAYTVSLSVFLTVFVLPVVGAIADRSAHKKELLAAFAYVGSGATVGFLFLTGDRYLLGAGLFLVANISFGAAFVVYNSFLPQLAGAEERDRVSSIGWAFGYLGGGLLLLLNVIAVREKELFGLSTADVARYSLASAGVWWAAFMTVPLLTLRNRPASSGEARGAVLSDGFRQLWHTLRSLRAYPLTLGFLIVYMIYNDGIQTVITMSSVYADKQLHLSQEVQVQTILMVQFLAFGGALGMGWLARRIGGWKTLILSLVLWTLVVGAAFALPEHEAMPFVGLGVALGIVLGGSQALSRSLFSQLIPPGKEGEYFGLYEISDKGTSWIGPLIFGLAFQMTHSYRVAIISLLVFFAVGIVGLLLVPMRRAIIAAGNTPPRVL